MFQVFLRFRGAAETNGIVFDDEGTLTRNFTLGDGINDVQTTRVRLLCDECHS
jgi:hypothetical protein